jgi:hypothetical protein
LTSHRYPTFIGAGAVDIYLFRNSDEAMVANYTDIPTARGIISASVRHTYRQVLTRARRHTAGRQLVAGANDLDARPESDAQLLL